MPELIEQMYCSQQIVIPPKFPYILKRYCKAAIKTQPYDLLRWSYEYFKALAEDRPPPVKLRLEYPVFSTEGGLTRGCLKVLANQLSGSAQLPLPVVKAAWAGFCLDPSELNRILCLCEVYLREEVVPFLHFIAVSAGLLTKSLTQTMILLCESLTKEPDGGSAAIPVVDFLVMYKLLAKMDASKDVKYINGYREGMSPVQSAVEEELKSEEVEAEEPYSDDYWIEDANQLQRLPLVNDNVPRSTRLSLKLSMPILGILEHTPSVERASQIERENYQRGPTGRLRPDAEINKKLQAMSIMKMSESDIPQVQVEEQKETKKQEKKPLKQEVEIHVYDEEDNETPYEFSGERKDLEELDEDAENLSGTTLGPFETLPEENVSGVTTAIIADFVNETHAAKQNRIDDMEQTYDEIAALVDRYNCANYDLGMVAGRQMSTTSAEFVVQYVERDIMERINEQIAVLPDPDKKKKKAKPEEVEMIRLLLETFVEENIDLIIPEIEEIEEEEQAVPNILVVYAVPGIGPPVQEDIIAEFEEYALDVCKVQADMFMPRNIRHFMCPALEMYEEYTNKQPADMHPPKEEKFIATGGTIAD
ncbi:hypothetical protein ACJJTC_019163 [Scirpophaga incertulas]